MMTNKKKKTLGLFLDIKKFWFLLEIEFIFYKNYWQINCPKFQIKLKLYNKTLEQAKIEFIDLLTIWIDFMIQEEILETELLRLKFTLLNIPLSLLNFLFINLKTQNEYKYIWIYIDKNNLVLV